MALHKFFVSTAFAVLWILKLCHCAEENNETSTGILGRTFHAMGDAMWDISHSMSEAMGHFDASFMHGGDGGHSGHWSHKNKTNKHSNSSCQSNHDDIESMMKIPLYVITPAIIIGVIILIKIIGIIVIGVPSFLAPLFSGIRNLPFISTIQNLFNHNDQGMEGGYGWGYPSPSPQYGPPAPSSSYGALQSSLSRQTSILNAIDDANTQYNGEYNPYQYQPQPPSSNYANSANYKTNYNYNSVPYAYSSPAAVASSSYNAEQSGASYSSPYESQSNNPSTPPEVNTNDAVQNYMQFVTQNKQQNASSKE